MADLIKNPSHYSRFKIEPADYAMDNELPHHVGSIVKYATRAGHKIYTDCDHLQSEKIDLQKAIEWAEKRIEKIDQEKATAEMKLDLAKRQLEAAQAHVDAMKKNNLEIELAVLNDASVIIEEDQEYE